MTPVNLGWAKAKVRKCEHSESYDPPEHTKHFTADEVDEMIAEIETLREHKNILVAACQYASGSMAQVPSTESVPPIVLHDCREHLEIAIAKTS